VYLYRGTVPRVLDQASKWRLQHKWKATGLSAKKSAFIALTPNLGLRLRTPRALGELAFDLLDHFGLGHVLDHRDLA
jgi:hypothetical protein